MKILSSAVPTNNSNSTNKNDDFNPTEFIVSLEGLLDVLSANVTIRPNQHQVLEQQQQHSSSNKNNNHNKSSNSRKTSPRHGPRSATLTSRGQQQQQHVDPLSLGASAISNSNTNTNNHERVDSGSMFQQNQQQPQQATAINQYGDNYSIVDNKKLIRRSFTYQAAMAMPSHEMVPPSEY